MSQLPPGVEPLTDEQIEQLDCVVLHQPDFDMFEVFQPSVVDFARAIEAKAAQAGYLAGLEAAGHWIDANEALPERRKLGDPNSAVVLAVAETGDGCLQITPAIVRGGNSREWREVRFDHDGQGRKLVVRCWRPMPAFPKQVPAVVTGKKQ